MSDLRARSIAIIRQYQAPNGAYVACPNYAPYKYCWLRDGTFIAYAMDRVGNHGSARRFYRWVHAVLGKMANRVEHLEDLARNGQALEARMLLPTRYSLDGEATDDGWPNFQLDGYGSWLWGLAQHLEMAGEASLLAEMGESIDLTIRYLALCWQWPNYDCWEESGDRLHPSTLASLYGGLSAVNRHLRRNDLEKLAAGIRQYILDHGVGHGRFVKSIGNPSVDASLLWLAVPYGVVPPLEARMAATVAEIECRLYHHGVHRYPEDTYYGGGEWILLACWLGWYYCQVGRFADAGRLLAWVENCASASGELPEQINTHVIAAEWLPVWERKWGPVATPLLWSHAMYLILLAETEGIRAIAVAEDGLRL